VGVGGLVYPAGQIFFLTIDNNSINTIESVCLHLRIERSEKTEEIGDINPSRQDFMRRNFRPVEMGVCFDDYFFSNHFNKTFDYPVYFYLTISCKNMKDRQFFICLENTKKIRIKKSKDDFF